MNQFPALHPNQAAFAGIRRIKGLYVDKTPWFRQLLEVAEGEAVPGVEPTLRNTHQFLARPRRFGKSLLVDTLEIWFQGLPPGHLSNPAGETGDWDELPAGWTSPAWLWAGLDGGDWHGVHGWHPVIRLDMSRVASPDPTETRRALQRYLWRQTNLWGRRGVPWGTPDWVPPTPDDSPADILFDVVEALGRRYGRKPVVLVDEYDAPITKHIGTDRDPQPTVEALQDCYRVLKDDQGLLYCVFLTGITRFARGHLFSAANNMTDISELPAHGARCGFTEAEVARDLEPYREALVALEPRFQDRDILEAWRDQYNGYRFAPFPSTPNVYNPFTLIHGLDRTLKEADLRSLAVAGHWPSAWSESGHPGLAARLAADTRQSLPGTVWEGGLPPLPEPGLGNLARPDYSRLMLDTGYYTWHGGTDDRPAHLNFPNREVAESWVFDILNVRAFAPERDGRLVRDLRACLARGDVPGFARRLETFAFGLARENLQSKAGFRTLLQSLFLQMAEPSRRSPPMAVARTTRSELARASTCSRSNTFGRSPRPAAKSGIGSTDGNTWRRVWRSLPWPLPTGTTCRRAPAWNAGSTSLRPCWGKAGACGNGEGRVRLPLKPVERTLGPHLQEPPMPVFPGIPSDPKGRASSAVHGRRPVGAWT